MSFSRIALIAALVAGISVGVNAANSSQSAQAAQANQAAQAISAQSDADQAQPAAKSKSHHGAARAAAKIDINNADKAQLAKIQGIGPKKAEAIVAYRTKNGPFKSIDDLKNLTNAKGKPLFTDKGLAKISKRIIIADNQQATQQS